MPNDLLLIGSIPLDTAEEVFRTFGTPLGKFLPAIPDGELGPRRHWISRIHYQVLALHHDIEVVRRPKPDDGGVERLNPRAAADAWHFKVRDGVETIRFGDPGWRLGYAREAINGYAIFRALKEKGVLPRELRFQVSLAMVNSAIPPRIFSDPVDVEKVRRAYQEAMAAELANIVDRIPAKELAIQWDCATEVQDAYGAIPGRPLAGAIERNLPQIRALSSTIPEGVALGYHLCFGTLGGWPRFAPDDLSHTVKLANAFIEASGRPADWMHIPLLDRTDDVFFAPLAELQPRGARVFLGAIHNMERFEERVAIARKFLPQFGVAAFCGFGRMAPKEMARVLEEHVRAAERMAR